MLDPAQRLHLPEELQVREPSVRRAAIRDVERIVEQIDQRLSGRATRRSTIAGPISVASRLMSTASYSPRSTDLGRERAYGASSPALLGDPAHCVEDPWSRRSRTPRSRARSPLRASTRSDSSKLERGPAVVPYGYGVRTRTRMICLDLRPSAFERRADSRAECAARGGDALTCSGCTPSAAPIPRSLDERLTAVERSASHRATPRGRPETPIHEGCASAPSGLAVLAGPASRPGLRPARSPGCC